MSEMNDKDYMRIAIELAKNGRGWTNPNPMVGAVIVKSGRIIGAGYHRKCGELHAERNAFASLKESAEGATIYVTLEPCCHYGKQPPCALAIIENKISRVVIGSRDPNPLVAGKGAKLLREHGIEVVEDFLRDDCDQLNPVFFKYITTGIPYTVMKYAMTLDGKIATRTGESKWITGEKARKNVHIQRSSYAAIMAGIGTVLADDPMLNVRLDQDDTEYNNCMTDISVNAPEFREKLPVHQPLRVVIDSKLRIPPDSNIVLSSADYPTVVACGRLDNQQVACKKKLLEDKGVKVIECPCDDGTVDLQKVMKWLGDNKYDSVYVEGGGTLHEGLVRAGVVDHVSAYIGPKLFGGKDAKSPVEGEGFEKVSEALNLKIEETILLGEDVLIECSVKK